MKRKKVFLMCGVPASGKSTFVQQNMNPATDVWCSRDLVRFSMISEDEEYFAREPEVFAREPEVFATWIKNINDALALDSVENIFVDATHLNKASRLKTLGRLNLENADVVPVVVLTSLQTCFLRNKKREGRARMPSSVIRRMYSSFVHPTLEEFPYKNIITVGKE